MFSLEFIRRSSPLAAITLVVAITAGHGVAAQDRTRPTTTAHPPLPGHASLYWLVPEAALAGTSTASTTTPAARLVRGATLISESKFTEALPLVSAPALAATPLATYARYYTGVAQMGAGRDAEAAATFDALAARELEGYLAQAVPMRQAELALKRNDPLVAARTLDDLSDDTVMAIEPVLLQLATALDRGGKGSEALEVYRRLYYEFPLSIEANAAQEAIERLQTNASLPPDRFKLELARAERLFTGRRWAQARAAFVPLARVAMNDERELVALRIAEADYYLNRHRDARAGLEPFLDDAPRDAEARFFYLTATRGLGDHATYVRLARELVRDEPDSSWAEETLNNLASHYITIDDEQAADEVFREMVKLFPKGRYGERAAWKIGWWSYKQGRFAETAELFEAAAAAYPRADYRPSWLYWAARSRDQQGQAEQANALYRLVASDYLNSYYGRLASGLIRERRLPVVAPIVRMEAPVAAPAPVVPTDGVIRALAAARLYDEALNEVAYAQRKWGDSAALQATVAWLRHQRGLTESAADRFADVRGAITTMRRAYPQFLAAGGENLPPDVLRVIYPLDYWPLIKKYSDAHGLDPYLMTALIAQESTFTRDVRSAANAVGLMQLIPPTARTVARQLGIRYNARILTVPETNIRLGMKYFKDMMVQFGGAHYALAGYNAGPHRVVRWRQERPGFEQDEWIDDIPFAETQAYVKRILGTAEDYRRLYGGGVLETN